MSIFPSARASRAACLTVTAMVALGALLASCTPKKTGTIADPTSALEVEEEAPPEGMPYKDMSKKQRVYFMGHVVLPTMKPIFQEFSSEKFAEVTCRTCHGEGALNHTFKMPDAEIAPLPKPENLKAFAEDPKNAPWVQFMAEKVKPTMAKLLDMTEFDPATNTGDFGCYACHTESDESGTSGGTN